MHCLEFNTTDNGNQQWKHYPLRVQDTGKGNHPAELLHHLEFHTSDRVIYSTDITLLNMLAATASGSSKQAWHIPDAVYSS
jgi:hypothetical protein